MGKNGFTLPEVLIAMLILIVIFGIFGISMIASFRVAKINWDMDGVVKEVSYLDFLMSEFIGKHGCEKDNINITYDTNAVTLTLTNISTISITFNSLKIRNATKNDDYIVIEATYAILNTPTASMNSVTLSYPLPDYCQ